RGGLDDDGDRGAWTAVRDGHGVVEAGGAHVETRRHAEVGELVVVLDDAGTVGPGHARAVRIAQRDEEGLVVLRRGVAAHVHVDGLRRLAGREGQRARGRVIVLAGAR